MTQDADGPTGPVGPPGEPGPAGWPQPGVEYNAEITDENVGGITRDNLYDALTLMRRQGQRPQGRVSHTAQVMAEELVEEQRARQIAEGNPAPQFVDISTVRRPADRIRGISSNAVIVDEMQEAAISPEMMRDVIAGFAEPQQMMSVNHITTHRLADAQFNDIMMQGLQLHVHTNPASVGIIIDRLVGPINSVAEFLANEHAEITFGEWTYYNVLATVVPAHGSIGDMTVVEGLQMQATVIMQSQWVTTPAAVDPTEQQEFYNEQLGIPWTEPEPDPTVIMQAELSTPGEPNRNGDVFDMDIRQQLTDNMIRDMNAEVDGQTIAAINREHEYMMQSNAAYRREFEESNNIAQAQAAASDVQALNEALFDQLSNPDSDTAREAVDAVNDFTRARMREDGFMRRILPPVAISNDELDRQVATDGISIPFESLPTNQYIRGPRHRVTFGRTGAVMSKAEDWATPDEKAEWAIWVPKKRCYLTISKGTVTWGSTVPKLKFPDRFSAEQFRPDLIEAHKAEVVQVTHMWYELEAVITNEDANGPKNFKDLRLVTFDQHTAYWTDPQRDDHSKPMRFCSKEQAEMIVEMVQPMAARHTHRSKPGEATGIAVLPCHTTQYRLPQPEVEVTGEYHKPLRSILLDE